MRKPGMAAATVIALLALVAAASASSGRPGHEVQGQEAQIAYRQVGFASWYGPGFQGNPTANGEIFDQNKLTAAHRDLPLGSVVTVTNLDNGRKVTVLINDRGPYVDGRVIDLSKAAAKRLDMVADGVVRVRISATQRQLASN